MCQESVVAVGTRVGRALSMRRAEKVFFQRSEDLASFHQSTDLETVKCPCCMTGPSWPVKHRFGVFRTVVCPNCGLEYLNPRLSKSRVMELYNSVSYYHNPCGQYGYFDYAAEHEAIAKTSRLRLQCLSRFQLPGRLLEVGAGFGYFLEEAERLGFRVVALEVSEIAYHRLKARFHHVKLGELQECRFDEEFDCVVAFDTVEHIYDLKGFVACVHAALKPGGVFALATPDNQSLYARIMRRKWFSYRIPEHVVFLNDRTLSTLLSPYFEIIYQGKDRQFITLYMAACRLRRLFPRLGDAAALIVKILRLENGTVRIPNGMKLYVSRKKLLP